MSMINVVYNQIIFPLFDTCKFHQHAHYSTSVVKTIEELMLYLVSTINIALKFDVCILVENFPFKWTNRLVDKIIFCIGTTIDLDEIGNALFTISFSIKLL